MLAVVRVASARGLGLRQLPWRSANMMNVVAAGPVQRMEANRCAIIMTGSEACWGRRLKMDLRALASNIRMFSMATFEGGFPGRERERRDRRYGAPARSSEYSSCQRDSYGGDSYGRDRRGKKKKNRGAPYRTNEYSSRHRNGDWNENRGAARQRFGGGNRNRNRNRHNYNNKQNRHDRGPQTDPTKGFYASDAGRSKIIIGRLQDVLKNFRFGGGPSAEQLLAKLRFERQHYNAASIHLMWTIVGHQVHLSKADDLLQELMDVTVENMETLDFVCVAGILKQVALRRIEVPETLYKPLLKKVDQAVAGKSVSLRDLSEFMWAVGILRFPLDSDSKVLLDLCAKESIESEEPSLHKVAKLGRNLAEAGIPPSCGFLQAYKTSVISKGRKLGENGAKEILHTYKLWNMEVPREIETIIEQRGFCAPARVLKREKAVSTEREAKHFEELKSDNFNTKEIESNWAKLQGIYWDDKDSGEDSLTELAQLDKTQVQVTNKFGTMRKESIEEIKLQDTNETNEKSEGENVGNETLSDEELAKKIEARWNEFQAALKQREDEWDEFEQPLDPSEAALYEAKYEDYWKRENSSMGRFVDSDSTKLQNAGEQNIKPETAHPQETDESNKLLKDTTI